MSIFNIIDYKEYIPDSIILNYETICKIMKIKIKILTFTFIGLVSTPKANR